MKCLVSEQDRTSAATTPLVKISSKLRSWDKEVSLNPYAADKTPDIRSLLAVCQLNTKLPTNLCLAIFIPR